jgi:HlyD family secretion protein
MKKSDFAKTTIGGAFAALLLLVVAVGCGTPSNTDEAQTRRVLQETVVPVTLHTVDEQPIQTTIELPGNFLPRRYSRIVPEIEGIIKSIPPIGTKIEIHEPGADYSLQLGVMYGLEVKKGQLLAQIDTSDLEIELKIAKAKLAKAVADLELLKAWRRPEEVKQLTAMRDQAKSQFENAQSEYNRIHSLFQTGSISVSEDEKSKTNLNTSAATLASAQANLDLATAGPTQQEIAVLQASVDQAEADVLQQEENIKKASIYAPYDGVITSMNVEVGERVTPSQGPIAEIMDLQYLVAEIGVPEEYRGDVEIYDRASVLVTGSNNEIPGIFVAINDQVAPETRTFKARVAIDNQIHKIRAGQFAKVLVAVGDNRSGSTISIPTRAMQFLEGQPCVFVYNEGTVRQRFIKIGISAKDRTEVISGVNVGDQIVLDDPALVTDGMKVNVSESAQNNPEGQLIDQSNPTEN